MTGTPVTSTQSSGKLNRVVQSKLADLFYDESGQDLIEYALLAALIGLAAATSMKGLATKIGTVFTSVGSTLTSAT